MENSGADPEMTVMPPGLLLLYLVTFVIVLLPYIQNFALRSVRAVFSTLIGREDHSVAPPALLCHKEPAHRKTPHLGDILLAPRWFFMV